MVEGLLEGVTSIPPVGMNNYLQYSAQRHGEQGLLTKRQWQWKHRDITYPIAFGVITHGLLMHFALTPVDGDARDRELVVA